MSLETIVPIQLELRYRFEPGQQLRYRVESSLDQEVMEAGQPVRRDERTAVLELVQRVLAVEPDGSAHVLTRSTGPEHAALLYQHLTPQGQARECAGPNPGSYTQLPDGPVSVGASWNSEIEVGLPGLSEVKLHCVSHVATIEEEMAVIQVRAPELALEIPLPDGSATARLLLTAEGSFRFDLERGRLERLEVTLRAHPRIGTASFDTRHRLVQELLPC